MRLFSPAKLNLFFRVLKKRSDGFHETRSLMQAISLGDRLTFEPSEQDKFKISHPEGWQIPTDAQNTLLQALHLFRKKTGYTQPLSIHLDKRIPPQAGLGGGSSNCATALWALRALSARSIPLSLLREWASEISSDAPFFLSSGTAYTSGRGEQIESLPPLPPTTLYLAKPQEGLSTPLVYKQCTPSAATPDPSLLLKEAVAGRLLPHNDLETSALSLLPSLKTFKKELTTLGFHTVAMTGSGSAFFCFGAPTEPPPPHIQLWEISYLARTEEEWFEAPHLESVL